MDFALIIIKQTVIMFLIIGVGALCYKTNIITKEGNKYLSSLVLKIVIPAMIFNAYQTAEYSPKLLLGLGQGFVLSIATYVISIPLGLLIFKKKTKERAIELFSTLYTNCAFMGFPLIEGIFGAEGILYTTSYVTMFNILVWTHGVMIMKDEMSIKSFFNALKSPAIIAVAVGIICYLLNLHLPKVPLASVGFIASMNTPLAMIIAGATIAQTNIINALKNARIYLVTLLKLFILPLITLFILKLIPASETVYTTIVIATSCPTATIGTIFAINFNKNATYASEIFAITTLLSAVSIPLITVISQMI